jgi:outer membrane receptor protein involved in Fe transport
MVYARFASGYRVGGLNFEAALLNVPEAYKPDRTYNYELGIKGAVWDRRLNFDASAYYINWKDIQINVINPTAYVSYVSNAGGAKSQGVELSVQARPIAALNVTASATFNDAKLTQDFPAPGPGQTAPIGHTGDRLPYSSRFSASLSADDDILHIGGATGFVGATVTYVGDREADFITGIPQRIRFPGYTDLDLRTGARYESWTVNLFLNNACDRRGISGGGVGYSAFPYNAVYIQPRTLGLSIAKSF